MVPDPLDAHFPTKLTVHPEITQGIKVNVPPLRPSLTDHSGNEVGEFDEYAVETHEWLSLISLNSPRVDPEDKLDPFLSRYAPPGDLTTRSKLVKATWQGFLSPAWAHKIFVQALLAASRDSWFSYSVAGFGEGWSGSRRDCTILKPPESSDEYVLWEVA